MLITVATPTHNRVDLLPRLVESLKAQTFVDFEWLVVDDGSTDGTGSYVKRVAADLPFAIRYHWQENGGKHIALNTAARMAAGRFVAVIDSDDWYLPHSLERLVSLWSEIADPEGFAEIQGLCQYPDGKLVGTRFPADVFDSNAFDIHNRENVKGDKVGMIRTDVLREFPFPEEHRRVYVTEALVWNRIGRKYATRYVNEVLAIKEYQAGGISDARAVDHLRRAGPRCVYFRELADHGAGLPFNWQLRVHANWARSALEGRQPILRELRRARSRSMFLLASPIGVLLALRDRFGSAGTGR